jgi:site-specific recombinase XerD
MNNPLLFADSSLARAVEAFVAYKRALDRKFDTEAGALRLFVRVLEADGVDTPGAVTAATIDRFLSGRPRPRPRSYNHLLGVLRRFFSWLVLQGVVEASPVTASVRRQGGQRMPYLFDLAQAHRLLAVARQLPDRSGAAHRGLIYETLFALLFGLGLRVGEACRLRVGDVDCARAVLTIRQTKFAKDRLVPFGPNMGRRLEGYLAARFAEIPADDTPLFGFAAGRAIRPTSVTQVFHALLPRLALEPQPGVAAPRLHDLRHSFAVGTLLRWYREGIDPNQRLLHLATFLGHVDPMSTAVYITMTDALLEEANARFRRFTGPLSADGGPQ